MISSEIESILSLLKEEYGKPELRPSLDPVGELIRTILTQNTSDKNSKPAFLALLAHFHSWNDILGASIGELAMLIRQGGLGKVKATRIQQALSTIKLKTKNLSLDFLANMPVKEARDWLKMLPGVGEKTASCVLLFAFGKPALPVDTHVYRLSVRLGLLNPDIRPDQASGYLEKFVPAEKIYEFHVLLISHGRKICKARNPLCQTCVLQPICPSAPYFLNFDLMEFRYGSK